MERATRPGHPIGTNRKQRLTPRPEPSSEPSRPGRPAWIAGLSPRCRAPRRNTREPSPVGHSRLFSRCSKAGVSSFKFSSDCACKALKRPRASHARSCAACQSLGGSAVRVAPGIGVATGCRETPEQAGKSINIAATIAALDLMNPRPLLREPLASTPRVGGREWRCPL